MRRIALALLALMLAVALIPGALAEAELPSGCDAAIDRSLISLCAAQCTDPSTAPLSRLRSG